MPTLKELTEDDSAEHLHALSSEKSLETTERDVTKLTYQSSWTLFMGNVLRSSLRVNLP